MSSKVFTNPTGAFGGTVDSELPAVVGSFRIAESSSAAVTITRGDILQIDTTGRVSKVDTADTDLVIGVALETVTVEDNNSAAYVGPKNVLVCLYGVCEVASGGTSVTFGSTLASNASGQAIAYTFADNDYLIGTALEATGAVAGTLVTALIRPQRTETV